MESSNVKPGLNNNQPNDNSNNSITLSDIFRVLRKNWILILIVTAVIFAAGAIYTYKIVKPTYKATSTISVEVPSNNTEVSVVEAGNSVTAGLRYVTTIADFVKSEAVMQAVAEDYKDITTYGKLRSSTSVSYDETSIIVRITVTTEEPKDAKTLALAIAEEVTQYSTDSKATDVDKFLCTIKVRDKAQYAYYASPNKTLYLIVSALAGLVLSLAIVFIKEFASNKFQTPDEIKAIGLPVVNILPNDKSKDKKDSESLLIPSAKNFEPYNRLASNVKFANVDNPYKVVMFTSTDVNELKTTVCSNYAFTLAHNEAKVIILDLDTRKPRLHEVFKVERTGGIVEYLSGDIDKESLIKKTEQGVDVITVGKKVVNPITLLESNKLKELITELKADYDYIILDTPPLIVCNDAAIISNLADGYVFNIAINQAKKKDVKTALEQLHEAGSNLIGINITKANVKDKGGYDYYYVDNNSSNKK